MLKKTALFSHGFPNPREDSPANGSTHLCALQSLLYISIRIPFRPRCFFVVASLNVLNHKALSYKFFEFPSTLSVLPYLHIALSNVHQLYEKLIIQNNDNFCCSLQLYKISYRHFLLNDTSKTPITTTATKVLGWARSL